MAVNFGLVATQTYGVWAMKVSTVTSTLRVPRRFPMLAIEAEYDTRDQCDIAQICLKFELVGGTRLSRFDVLYVFGFPPSRAPPTGSTASPSKRGP